MLKIDLGITATARDDYFNNFISASKSELEEKGVVFDLEKTEDIMLLSDYSAWKYRKRQENIPLAENLRLRIINRKVKKCVDNG